MFMSPKISELDYMNFSLCKACHDKVVSLIPISKILTLNVPTVWKIWYVTTQPAQNWLVQSLH